MNKSELVDSVAGDAGVEKKQAESVLNAFFQRVASEAKGGRKVAWPGFGSFSSTKRAARTGRNPQTGAPVKIKASTAMKFTSSSTLKDALNNRGAKKATAKKSAAKKSTAKKATAKKATAKKATAKRSTAKKATAKRSPAKKAKAKKSTAKRSTAKKATAKKATKRR